MGKFNQLRSHPETGFPIVIAYEKSPMFNIKFVCVPVTISLTLLPSNCRGSTDKSIFAGDEARLSHQLLQCAHYRN